MAVRKAETVYLGDATSVVKAAQAAQKANAEYAAKVKASAEQIIAAQDKVAVAGDKAAAAALKAGDSAAKAAALAGRAALDQSKAIGDSTAKQVAAYRAATDAALKAADEQSAAARKTAETQAAAATKNRESVVSGLKQASDATLALAGVSVYAAVQFQKNMTLVHTQAGASTAEVNRMSKAVLNLGLTTEQGPNKLAQALYPIESVGLRGADALSALAAASKGAAVGGSDLTETTHALAGVMVALHEKGQQAATTMAAIDAVVGVGKMTMQDFVDALSSGIVPTATAVGLSFNALGAGLATLTDAGIPAEQAATKMRTILLLLAHEHTKEAVSGLQDIGLTADELATAMRKPGNGLLDVLQLLHDHMDGLSKVKQVDLLSSLAGGSRSAGTLITLEQQLGRVGTKYGQITQLSGQFNSRVAAESATASHKIKVAWSDIQVTAIQVGQMLAPVAMTLAHDVSMVANAWASLPSGLQHTIITGGLILAGVSPALKVLSIFTGGLNKFWAAAQLISGARVLGGGTVSTAGSAASVATSTSTGGAGLAAGFKGIASRAVGGFALGGLGVMIAQTVGSAIHGAAGSAIKEIGTDASIGAGVGAIFGPAGMAGGALIGGLVGSVSHFLAHDAENEGKQFADKFTANLPGKVSDAVKQGVSRSTAKAVTTYTPGSLAARGAPGAGGMSKLGPSLPVVTAATLKKQFDQLYSVVFVAGKQAGGAFVAGWQAVKFPTQLLLVRNMQQQLDDVPAAIKSKGPQWVALWQDQAAKQMLGYATSLEQNGKLPKGAVDQMIATLEQSFPGLTAYLDQSGQQTENVIAKAMKLTVAQTNWRNALTTFRTDWGDTAISQKITTDNIASNTTKAMADLRSIMATGTKAQRAAAKREYDGLQRDVSSTFSNMLGDVDAKQKAMTKSIASGSAQAAAQAGTNLYGYEQNVYAAMAAGLLSSNQGAALITKALDATLKAFGAKQIPMPTAVSGLATPGKGLRAGTNAAQGTLIQFGRAGAHGHDAIPVNFGGVPVVVGSGEVGAVLTHDQQAFLNARTADVGGLSGMFSRLRRPHYMASGGLANISTPHVSGTGTVTSIAQAGLALAASAANSMLQRLVGSTANSGGIGGPVPPGSVRDWLTAALTITNHMSPGNLSALYGRTMQESGGNPRAINLWDSNAAAGHPSKGLLQTIDSTFSSYELPGHGDIWNPIDNAIAAVRYMFARYGHVVGPSGSGYAAGGMVPFVGSFKKGGTVPRTGIAHVHKGEVITPADAINSSLAAVAGSLYPIDASLAALANLLQKLQGETAPNHDKQIAGLAAELTKIRQERINLPVPASGKAGDAQRIANEKERKKLATETLAIEDKIRKLKADNKTEKDNLATEIKLIGVKQTQLTQLKSFKDAIASLYDQVKSLASQAAQAWRTAQEAQINSTHDSAITAIGNSPAAQQLAAMQAQDTATANANQLASLQGAITTDQFNVAHSAGQAHLDALAQLKTDQQALTDFQRQQDEQRLQDQIDAATKAADTTQQTALSGLDQQQADYQAFLQQGLGALTDNLNARKITYAQWAKDVNAILAQYGLAAQTDPSSEQSVDAGPGSAGTPAKKSGPDWSWGWGKYKGWGGARAAGGSVQPGYVYRVGEQGPEDVMFGARGTVLNASETRRRNGGQVHIEHFHAHGVREARAFADRIAFRAAIGTP